MDVKKIIPTMLLHCRKIVRTDHHANIAPLALHSDLITHFTGYPHCLLQKLRDDFKVLLLFIDGLLIMFLYYLTRRTSGLSDMELLFVYSHKFEA